MTVDPGQEPEQKKAIDIAHLVDVPQSVAKGHAQSLTPAAEDIQKLAMLGAGSSWRAKSLGRVVDQFYRTLGRALDQAPEDIRTEVAQRSIAAFVGLAEDLSGTEHLLTGLGATLGLVDHTIRLTAKGRLTMSPTEHLQVWEEAASTARSLRDGLGARFGIGRALNLLPLFTEQVERALPPLSQAKRKALIDRVQRLLISAIPKTGLDPATTGQLARAVVEALKENPKTAAEALNMAEKRFLALHKTRRAEVMTQIRQPDPQIRVGTPAKERFDSFNTVLARMLKSHATGPETIFEDIFQLRHSIADHIRRWPMGNEDIHTPLADLLNRFADTELAQPLVRWINNNLNRIGQNPTDTERLLKKANRCEDLPQTARVLTELMLFSNNPEQAKEHKKELGSIARLPPKAAMFAFFAIAARPNTQNLPAVLRHIAAFAQGRGHDDMLAFLSVVAERSDTAVQQLKNNNVLENHPKLRDGLARTLVESSAECRSASAGISQSCRLMSTIQNAFPKANLDALLVDGADGRPGVWSLSDPSTKWRHEVRNQLQTICNTLSAIPRVATAKPAAQTEIVRFALELTAVMANLEGNIEIPTKQIIEDLRKSFEDPTPLAYATKGAAGSAIGVQARRIASVASYRAAHPNLPAELLLTSGLHLNGDQVGWLVKKSENVRGRDTLRSLRDFVFACVSSDCTDFIDTVRKSAAPSKAIDHCVRFVGLSYRENKLDQVPWEELTQKLEAGEDPIVAIERREAQAALDALQLRELVAQVDPVGMAELSRCSEAIRYIMEHLEPGQKHDDIDTHERLHGIFREVLKSVAEGTWPKPKYESKAGKKNLSILTPEQRAIWRSENVTTGGPAAVGEADMAKLNEAVALLRGMATVLTHDRKLIQLPGFDKLTYSKVSLKRVEQEYDALLTRLRRCRKGSKNHKALTKRIGPVRNVLSLLRFQLAFKKAEGDPQTLLFQLRGEISGAKQALRKAGLDNLTTTLSEVSYLTASLQSAKGGSYAADEDNLHALITSTAIGAGCCSFSSFRRYTNVSFAANATEKFIRSYENGKPVVRGLLKLMEAELPDGYKGPVLWLNNTNYGGSDEAKNLLIEHAVKKAKEMGIPIVSAQTDLSHGAKKLGLEQQNERITIKVADNWTGTSFTNYCGVDSDKHDIRTKMGDKPHLENSLTCNFVRV